MHEEAVRCAGVKLHEPTSTKMKEIEFTLFTVSGLALFLPSPMAPTSFLLSAPRKSIGPKTSSFLSGAVNVGPRLSSGLILDLSSALSEKEVIAFCQDASVGWG